MNNAADTVRVDHSGRFMAVQQEGVQRANKLVSEVISLSVLSAWLAEPVIALVVASFSDGRVFTVARQLRQIGFEGRLEVVGDLLPDQLPMLFESGVDVLEISAQHARRCDEAQWTGKAAQWAGQAAQGRFGYQHHNGRTVSVQRET